MKTNDDALIDDYLHHQLTPAERLAFEARLAQEPQLAAQLAQTRQVVAELRFLGQRQKTRALLDSFHQDLNPAEVDAGLRRYARSFTVLRRKYLPTVAAAASVAVITVFSILLMRDYLRGVENSLQTSYRSLARQFGQIKKKQEVLQDSIEAVRSRDEYLKQGATGFAISADGYLLTNYHPVEKSDSIFIESVTPTNERYRVELVYGNRESDVALLKVVDEKFKGFSKIPYTFKSSGADLGEEIFTLAYPRDELVYGEGSLSARTGFEGDQGAYQVSIPVNPGNSGSPVFDAQGNLIGLIKGKQLEADGVAFAIKSAAVLEMIEKLPSDTLKNPLNLSRANKLAGLKRSQQIKRIEEFVFQVKVY
ncbi:MAG: trypsin-like peptidase domain-containing protein [Bernardetiaceae bacterium]|nr:trypsin-like peptidase domain-containing protein [Bernardetiaceae bacterium]